jgi:hypothetical protein
MSKVIEAMKEHGIRSPYDLTEFDQWVNEAQRADINDLLKERGEEKVFGLKLNPLTWIPGAKLKDMCNFGVDYIFDEDDYHNVELAIYKYMEKNYSRFLDELAFFALDCCLWV